MFYNSIGYHQNQMRPHGRTKIAAHYQFEREREGPTHSLKALRRLLKTKSCKFAALNLE